MYFSTAGNVRSISGPRNVFELPTESMNLLAAHVHGGVSLRVNRGMETADPDTPA